MSWHLPCVQIIEDAAMHDQYCRVITPEPAINEETEEVCTLLKQCYALRCTPSCPFTAPPLVPSAGGPGPIGQLSWPFGWLSWPIG